MFFVSLTVLAGATSPYTDEYTFELERQIDELQALIDNDLGTDRDIFMLNYYKKRLNETVIEAAGTVVGVFTSDIGNKEPVDNISSISARQDRVYFYTELTNLAGEVITHRWMYQGQIIFEKKFHIGGDRWRIWSYKTLDPRYTGKATVQVLNSEGRVIGENHLTVTP